ncbi:carboxypeptidase-like regulatory domain-containing protein [Granulicella sp. dw_53]|uniref:carboxypeptidase-like regulatory domain-containing protein n=1 Tax=Granulicella sp. dw_53 TaxID=2719792 RepID=UPI001BD1F4F0|nr:carboxypeptidase-like regulatory domain-containing protein [Granulicella sp. dw_53]
MHRYAHLLLLPPMFSQLAVRSFAQQSPYVVGSTITGHVICADTNTPARFAKVFLKSTAPDHSGEDFLKRFNDDLDKSTAGDGPQAKPVKPPSEEQQRIRSAAARNMNRATDLLSASTVGLDGYYSFAGIKPGTYYLHTVYNGYVDPFDEFSAEDLESTDPAVHARVAARLVTVNISGTDSARVDLRIERGAALSGRVVFDDGTPAAGWILSVIHPKSVEDPADVLISNLSQVIALGKGIPLPMTDDLGHYRIAGLPAGDYTLRANLRTASIGISAANIGDGGSGIDLAVYSGNTFSRSDAKSFKLAAGEEHAGIDITIPARSLHNIIGYVAAKTDGHTLNSGEVSLTSKGNPALHLKAAIRDDGSFHYEYLPPGAYTITVDDAADSKITGSGNNFMGLNIPDQEITHKYGTTTTDITLTDSDVDSIHLTVAEVSWTPPEKKPRTQLSGPDDAVGIFDTAP